MSQLVCLVPTARASLIACSSFASPLAPRPYTVRARRRSACSACVPMGHHARTRPIRGSATRRPAIGPSTPSMMFVFVSGRGFFFSFLVCSAFDCHWARLRAHCSSFSVSFRCQGSLPQNCDFEACGPGGCKKFTFVELLPFNHPCNSCKTSGTESFGKCRVGASLCACRRVPESLFFSSRCFSSSSIAQACAPTRPWCASTCAKTRWPPCAAACKTATATFRTLSATRSECAAFKR